jgi:hypothetical protein
MQADLADGAKAGERALAEVVVAHFRRVGEEDAKR